MLPRLLSLGLFVGLTLLNAQDKPAETGETGNFGWEVANFVLFAGLIGYFIVKYAASFFNARSADIQKAIQEATGLKLNADLRYSEIDRKMANLSSEVGKLRAEAQQEMGREHQRMLAQTKEEIAYIQRSTVAEIEGLRNEGADRLRVHATTEALARAETRLRERFANSDQQDQLAEFVNLVERGKN